MMIDAFLIALSEALLLGLCVGEYQTKLAAKPNPAPRFVSILELRVTPHVPSFGQQETTPLATSQLPENIKGDDLSSGGRRGTTTSELTHFFVGFQYLDARSLTYSLFTFPPAKRCAWSDERDSRLTALILRRS